MNRILSALVITGITAFLFVAVSANAQTVFLPRQGGTGTGSIPSYGQVLVGNGAGIYAPMSTSSLGITGTADGTFSTTSADYWESLKARWATSSTDYWAQASSSLPKTYLASSWTALQTFAQGIISQASSTIAALHLGTPLEVASGGTASTTLGGILKGNGTSAIVSAVAGTDYQAPISATYPLLLSSNTLSLAFGTTTANTWTALQAFSAASTTDFTGVDLWLIGQASGCAQFDSSGKLTSTGSACGSGSGTPAGSSSQIQYNDGGSFAATSTLLFNTSNPISPAVEIYSADNTATTSISGGHFDVIGGSAQISSDSNSIYFYPSTNTVTRAFIVDGTTDTLLYCTDGSGFCSILDFSLIQSSDKTLTVPDETGTFTLAPYSGGFASGAIPFGNNAATLATSSAFTWNNTSSLLSFTNGSTSALTNTGSTWLTSLATPAGTILAVDPNGKVIATTTSAGGVTSISATWPILSTGGSTPTISWGGLSTTTNLTVGQVVYASGTGSITSVASSSLTFSGPFSGYSSLGALVGGTNSTVTWTGLATTSQPSSSNLLVSNGSAGVYGVATSTLSATSPLTGSFVQIGSSGSIGCQTASGAQAGCLSSTDWNTFNGKSGWPLTPSSYNGVPNQSTTTALWLKNTTIIATSTLTTDIQILGDTGVLDKNGARILDFYATSGANNWVYIENKQNDDVVIGATSTTNTDVGYFFKTLGYASVGFQCGNDTVNCMKVVNGSNAVALNVDTANMRIGVATDTPWATFSVKSDDTSAPQMVVGSSTSNSLVISNKGLLTFGSASSTLISATTAWLTNLYIGSQTLAAYARGLLSATYPLQYNSGTGAFSLAFGTSTSNTWGGTQDFSSATLKQHTYSSFTYSTTTAWTGTTTIPLGPAYTAESWSGAKCFTDTGTVKVQFYDGTNRMNLFQASTTVGTVALSTNNTFTASEKRYVDIGTPASSPTKITCTVDKIVNN